MLDRGTGKGNRFGFAESVSNCSLPERTMNNPTKRLDSEAETIRVVAVEDECEELFQKLVLLD